VPRVALVSDLVRARIALANADEAALGGVPTAPAAGGAVRKLGRKVDTDALAARIGVNDAAEPASPGRIANVLRNTRRGVASHAHRGAPDIATAPFAVIGQPRMPLDALFFVANEGS
jgi:hypothetical protein